jgi:hypothetical protein
VCGYAIDAGGSDNRGIGCRSVTVPTGSPFGYLDTVTPGPGSVTVSGWATDPDTWAPVQVVVTVGGTPTTVTANGRRPDVAAVHPGWGSGRGYSATLSAPAGAVTVCATARDAASSAPDTAFGCRTVTVPPA